MQSILTNLGTVTPDEAEETLQTVTDFLKGLNLEKLITLLLLLAGCLVVMKLVLRLTDRAFLRLELERSLHTFIHAALRVILWMITLCIVLDYVGVPMTSLVAVLSVIGLAVSLAIQGTLSNLAGGIQVLLSKPFKAGDYVEAGGISGTVQEVGLAYTKLCTVDNKVISVPNGQISGEKIINYSTEERRRVDLTFNASYDSPLQQVTGHPLHQGGAHGAAQEEEEPAAPQLAQAPGQYGAGQAIGEAQGPEEHAAVHILLLPHSGVGGLQHPAQQAVAEKEPQHGIK